MDADAYNKYVHIVTGRWAHTWTQIKYEYYLKNR